MRVNLIYGCSQDRGCRCNSMCCHWRWISSSFLIKCYPHVIIHWKHEPCPKRKCCCRKCFEVENLSWIELLRCRCALQVSHDNSQILWEHGKSLRGYFRAPGTILQRFVVCLVCRFKNRIALPFFTICIINPYISLATQSSTNS